MLTTNFGKTHSAETYQAIQNGVVMNPWQCQQIFKHVWQIFKEYALEIQLTTKEADHVAQV